MSKIILVCGPSGAGKSTYARHLADEIGGVRLSLDDWLDGLYRDDRGDEMQYDWALARINRIERQLYALIRQMMERGIPVILDHGFFKQEHRQKFYDWAAEDGFIIECHLLELDKEIRWQRVEQRNRDQGDTFSLVVDRDMFEFGEGLFERPQADELDHVKFIKGA